MRPVEVSVVLAVRNDPPGAESAVRSVLGQTGVEIEVVAIDDGSDDATGSLLDRLSEQDDRLRVLHEPHRGLTGALARGCGVARAPWIARQDAGDWSEPDRLRRQMELVRSEPGLVFVSCCTRCLGPGGELLQVVQGGRSSSEPVRLDPAAPPGNESCGPTAHGSVVFQRAAYEAAGGYRQAFRLAQDWDLWWRLAERGEFALVPEVLYTRTLTLDSLSFTRSREQARLGELARDAALARLEGRGDEQKVEEAAALSARIGPAIAGRRERARALYFIGSLLRERHDPRARAYFARALRQDPFSARAWLRWMGNLP